MTSLPSRFHDVERSRLRFGDRVLRLGSFLLRGDPAADAAVESVASFPPESRFELVDRGSTRGSVTLSGAPPALRAFFEEAEEVPLWVDDEVLERGGRLLFRAGFLGGLVLGASSLVRGYASPGGNKPLVFSGRLREGAARRLSETGRFVQATCAPGGLRRFAPGYAITLKVRLMHAQVRRMLERSPKWRSGEWGVPINQHDMVGTTLLFSYAWIVGLRVLGMTPTPPEVADFIQLWRYSGRLIGVDAELLPTSEPEAARLAEMIAATQGEPDDDARMLTRALLDVDAPPRNLPERAMAPRRRELGEAFTRELCGDELADALGIPRTPWVHAVSAVRGVTAAAELLRERVPAIERQQLEVGVRYWDQAVSLGLAGMPADFRMPERLGSPVRGGDDPRSPPAG